MMIVRTDLSELTKVQQAMEQAPFTAGRYIRQELDRGGKLIKRIIKKERLSGPPGIRGGAKLKGSLKHEVTPVGTAPMEARVRVYGAGKIWAAHEEGATILGRPYLYVELKESRYVMDNRRQTLVLLKAGSLIRIRKAILQPRLQFITTATRVIQDKLVGRIEKAAMRALDQASKGLGLDRSVA